METHVRNSFKKSFWALFEAISDQRISLYRILLSDLILENLLIYLSTEVEVGEKECINYKLSFATMSLYL